MGTIAQLIPPTTDERVAQFEEFNKWYPHNPGRRDKAKARVKFMEITGPLGTVSRSLNKDSGQYDTIPLKATPEQLVDAVKAYRKSLIPPNTSDYKPETSYVPYASVWLNQGRFEDYMEG